MSCEAVAQGVGRNIGNARAHRMGLNDGPRCLPRQPSRPGSEKQIWSRFIPESLAHTEIPLQPMHRALPDRNSSLLAAFAVTRNQRRINIDVAGLEHAQLRNAQARSIHHFQDRAITHSRIRPDVGSQQQPLHLFFS